MRLGGVELCFVFQTDTKLHYIPPESKGENVFIVGANLLLNLMLNFLRIIHRWIMESAGGTKHLQVFSLINRLQLVILYFNQNE